METTDEKKKISKIQFIFIGLIAVMVLAVAILLVIGLIRDANTPKEPDSEEIVSENPEEELPISEENESMESQEPTEEITEEPNSESDENVTVESEEVLSAEAEEENHEFGMFFESVEETVTAKNATNLRDIPSQGEDSTVMLTLQNGQTATRIGISDSGWSKLEYEGEIYYAVSNYLTTDLTYKPQEVPEDDGIKTVFTDCNDRVTPKIEVNLRALPSVTNPDATVIATIRAGEIVERTGINTDVGWSRVIYNGQTLYCISSYVYPVE